MIHRYDKIRAMPVVLANVHESLYSRSYHVLGVVKELATAGVPSDKILAMIEYLETPLPASGQVQVALKMGGDTTIAEDFEEMRQKSELAESLIRCYKPPTE